MDRDAAADSGAQTVTVMTQNLYVGADLDAVIAALVSPDPNDDFPALLAAIQTLGETDFPTRAAAIADEIAKRRPHLVGMQEVSEINIDLTALGLPIQVHLDFLPIVQAALDARGLHYEVAASVENIDATPVPGVNLVDSDVMLVDADRVSVGPAFGQVFATNLGVIAPGVELKRGWVQAAVTIDGTNYTVVSTHFEPGFQPGFDQLRAAQAAELAGRLASQPRVILMGDLNDLPGTPMYQVLTGAGLTDVWAALRPGAPGYTCCHQPDLADPIEHFDLQEDYFFVRGIGHIETGVLGDISRFGLTPSDRLDGPTHSIWPSDHSGVVADLRIPPANGLH